MISVNEQDINLINDILERNYYYYYKKGNEKKISLSIYNNNNYNNSIFTKQVIKQEENNIILNNLEKILNWYNKNNFICDIYIEDEQWFFNDKLKKEILNLLLEKLITKNINIFLNFNISNLKNEDLDFLKEKIQIFKEKNINLIINFTIDISFLKEELLYKIINNYNIYNYNLINIITSENVQYQKNFFNSFNNNFLQKIIIKEKESENWTEEKIYFYIEFINYYIDNLIKDKGENSFINSILNNNSFISLKDNGIIDNKNCSGHCNFYKNLHIIVNNLTISPCKKIQYEELIIGYFKIEENELSKCYPINISSLILCTHLKRNMTPQCEYCSYIGFCSGFCHGDAYYKALNPIIPIRETCMLRKAKYSFILYKILKLNYQNIILEQITNLYYKDYLYSLFEQVGGTII